MAQVNAYGAQNYGKTAIDNPANTAKSSSSGNSLVGGSNSLGIQDFMSLLAAQLANQDVMNPMQDTDFIAQMAQFTSLQAMQTLSEITYAQYGASMIGKNVSVAAYDDMGNYTEDKGVVTSVKFANGECLLEVNGQEYTMSSIMEILNSIDDVGDGDDGTGGAGDGDNDNTGDGGDGDPPKPEQNEKVPS